MNAEFTSFPQLKAEHSAQGGAMTAVAGAIDGQVAGLLVRGMGNGALIMAMMAAQEAANLSAAKHAEVAWLAGEQFVVMEAHAQVGGSENVADKEAYDQA